MDWCIFMSSYGKFLDTPRPPLRLSSPPVSIPAASAYDFLLAFPGLSHSEKGCSRRMDDQFHQFLWQAVLHPPHGAADTHKRQSPYLHLRWSSAPYAPTTALTGWSFSQCRNFQPPDEFRPVIYTGFLVIPATFPKEREIVFQMDAVHPQGVPSISWIVFERQILQHQFYRYTRIIRKVVSGSAVRGYFSYFHDCSCSFLLLHEQSYHLFCTPTYYTNYTKYTPRVISVVSEN